jgi:hypothetical protein
LVLLLLLLLLLLLSPLRERLSESGVVAGE